MATYRLDKKGDKHFTFSQALPAILWNVQHNLCKEPSCVIVDSAGTELEGEITHIDENNLTITFNTAVSGKAQCN